MGRCAPETHEELAPMGDGLRTVRILTKDDSLLASARTSLASIGGWELHQVESSQELLESPPCPGDLLLVDAWVNSENAYELCRKLTGHTRCRTFLVVDLVNDWAEPIARFCGATGVLHRPLTRGSLTAALQEHTTPAAPLPSAQRSQGEMPDAGIEFPSALLTDLKNGKPNSRLIAAVIDESTGLFNYAFLNYKLDEEFKRARRFGDPLACVMLGFEGQADDGALKELAGIFLASSRDTDILGRFDESSFLFLLPGTGVDGASIMAHRVAEMAEERGLTDLVGDPMCMSVGIATYPSTQIERREDLYQSARDGFVSARSQGGGVVITH